MIRRLFLGVLLSLGLAGPAFGATLSPGESIHKLYKAYQAVAPDQWVDPLDSTNMADLMTDELYALYLKGGESAIDGELPLLDFDPFVNGQDFEITNLTVTSESIDDKRQTVTARFLNFDAPRIVIYDFVLTDKGWRFEDMRYPVGEDIPDGFSLKAYLSQPWPPVVTP